VNAFARRGRLAPAALVYAQLAHGFSWLLVFWAAWSGNLTNPLYGFAWIHAVALAWVTMTALSIFIDALPNLIEVPWRGRRAALLSIVVYGAGVALLIAAFLGDTAMLAPAASLLLLALAVYLATAFRTIASAMRGERIQRAVARAFGGTFLFLLATAIAGFALPTAHAALGTLGWLSLLIFGISMRTIRIITDEVSRFRRMHIVVGSLSVLGVPILAAGVAAHIAALAWTGGTLFSVAALGYAFDVLDMVRRSRNPYRPPQAFIVVAIFWLLASLVLGAGVLSGKPWQQAYMFLLLIGWVGQMVNAHVYAANSPDLLETRLSWYSFFAFQVAIAVLAAGLLSESAGLAARGALFGAVGWIAMMANMFAARTRAKTLAKVGTPNHGSHDW